MSKSLLLALIVISHFLVFLSPSVLAVTIRVQDPCSEKNWLETEISANKKQNIGELSIQAMEDNGIEFIGTATGINSINGSVTGLDALEVLGDKEMKAYGWCYKVDGIEPSVLPHKLFIKTGEEKIHWFFAYSHYLNGNWITMCSPTAKTKPEFICK